MRYAQFHDRRDAGRRLAALLTEQYGHRSDVVVLALPRGGVPVAFEVARALSAPLDVFLVRKLGAPGQEELAIGAIASGNVRVLNDDIVRLLQISPAQIERIAAREQREIERREHEYRDGRAPLDVRDKTCILIDDGLATGATMRAAAIALRQSAPARIIVAVPTAAPQTCEDLAREVDQVISVITPEPFHAVGLWYADFDQVSDDEVRELLEAARHNELTAQAREPTR